MQGEHKNNVLLTELIIVALFFSLIAVTVVQMFVAAHRRSANGALEQRAQIVAQDWAERISGHADAAAMLLSEGFEQSGERAFCREQAGDAFRVEVSFGEPESSNAGSLVSAQLKVFDEKAFNKVFDEKALSAEEKPEAKPIAPLAELALASYISAEGVAM